MKNPSDQSIHPQATGDHKKARGFEKLLVELCEIVSDTAILDSSIEKCLEKFIQFLDVDQSTLMEFRENHTQLWITHNSVRPGIPPLPPVQVNRQFPWYTETLRRGDNVVLENIEEAPLEAALDKHNAKKIGLKAILTIPLKMEGSITYALSIGSGRSEHRWPSQVVQRVELLGEILVNALKRQRHGHILQEKELLFQELAEGINQIFWFMELNPKKITYVSPTFERIFGPPAEELYQDSQCWMNAVHPEDRLLLEKLFENWIGRTEQIFDMVYRIVDREGHIKYLRDRRTLLRRPNGEIYQVRGIADDITELKRHELELKEREEYFRLMADTAPVMIWSSGIDKGCNYFNKPWLEFRGRSYEQELGDGWIHGVHPEDLQNCLETYRGAFDARQDFRMSYRLRRHDGAYRWVIDTGTPQYSPEGAFTGYIGSCFDITEIEMAKKELHDVAGRVILAQEQERWRIARELHDDVNQRLSLISVELQLLANGQGNPQDDFRKSVVNLQKKIESLSSDLHNLSHQLHPAKLDKLGLLPTVKGYIREMKKIYNFTVVFSEEGIPDPLPMNLAICLFRIIQEAVWNAKKYSEDTHAFIELIGKPDRLYLKIYDFGVGFDLKARQETTGIGISGMEERARLMGGTLGIFSQKGEGTRIEVKIPISSAFCPK